jgi:hypothetical protein
METKNTPLFGKDNLRWMLIGIAVIVVGAFLMIGGKSTDPTVFNEAEVYSFRRITLAPILIVVGLLIEVFAIMKKSK